MPYQLGCFNRPWNQLSYEEALRGIAEAGFTEGPALIECLGGEGYEAITAEAKRAREYLLGIL